MPHHRTLTGNDLHEPKGAATAPAGSAYIADGGGSGSWELLEDFFEGYLPIYTFKTSSTNKTAEDGLLVNDSDLSGIVLSSGTYSFESRLYLQFTGVDPNPPTSQDFRYQFYISSGAVTNPTGGSAVWSVGSPTGGIDEDIRGGFGEFFSSIEGENTGNHVVVAVQDPTKIVELYLSGTLNVVEEATISLRWTPFDLDTAGEGLTLREGSWVKFQSV